MIYTIVGEYPDHEHEVFVDHIEAKTAQEAAKECIRKRCEESGLDESSLRLIAQFEGEHNDILFL